MPRDKLLKAAVADLSAAKAKLAKARQTLARQTKPGDPNVLVDPAWAWAEKLLEKRRAQLLAIEGVIGCGLGFRIKKMQETPEPCISVFVRKKFKEATLKKRGRKRLPKFMRSGKRRLRVDVVQLGRLKRQAAHPGISLGPIINQPLKGTLGAFAQNTESPGTVAALTAMHVSGISEYPGAGSETIAFSVPSRLDNPTAQLFGYLQRGSMTGIDAAKISLSSPQETWNVIPSIGEIKGWRPTVYPGDKGTTVRMYGANSAFQQGYIVNPGINLPQENLEAAILVKINSQGGDSGAALVDPQNYLLGFLVGMSSSGDFRIFCPASLTLARLGCDIPHKE